MEKKTDLETKNNQKDESDLNPDVLNNDELMQFDVGPKKLGKKP